MGFSALAFGAYMIWLLRLEKKRNEVVQDVNLVHCFWCHSYFVYEYQKNFCDIRCEEEYFSTWREDARNCLIYKSGIYEED